MLLLSNMQLKYLCISLAGLLFMVTQTSAAEPIFSTSFEDTTKLSENKLDLSVDNWFEFGDSNQTARMWVDNSRGHTGSKSIGLEITDPTVSRRAEFNLMQMSQWAGDEITVSVWQYLPADYNLNAPNIDWNWHEFYVLYGEYSSAFPQDHYLRLTITQPDITQKIFNLGLGGRTPNGVGQTGIQYSYGTINNFQLPRGEWFNIRSYLKRDETNGAAKVWINDQLVFDESGIQTKVFSDYHITVGKIYNETTDTTTHQMWVDDVQVYAGYVPPESNTATLSPLWGLSYQNSNQFPWTDSQLLRAGDIHNVHVQGFGSIMDQPNTIYSKLARSKNAGVSNLMLTISHAPARFKDGNGNGNPNDDDDEWDAEARLVDVAGYVAAVKPIIKTSIEDYGVRWIQIGNEMKGFWDSSKGRWDYESYTNELYNPLYDYIKNELGYKNVLVAGPYVPFRNRDFGHDVGIGGWEIDSRDIDMADYWFEHKLGSDAFIYDSDDETSSTVQWALERYNLPVGVTETYSKAQAEASFAGGAWYVLHWAESSYGSIPQIDTSKYQVGNPQPVTSPSPSPSPSPIDEASPSPVVCVNDLNSDGVIDGSDYTLMANNFLTAGTNSGDLNNDGVVDGTDYSLLALSFLSLCQ